jgi:cobyrinic acid a,c-diamide synthase
MSIARLVIAAPSSGCGKTTVTLGLLAALRRRGLVVQAFKVGPDYIDPSYHTALTGRPSRNLDTWMLPSSVVREVFQEASADADVCVIEGVMGMFDGVSAASDVGSTAEIAALFQAPVLFVLDGERMARSAAAVVLGFQHFHPEVHLAGVIANRVAGEGHARLIQTAVEGRCQVPLLGYLPVDAELRIPDRHLGLVPAIERGDLEPLFERLADYIDQYIQVPEILTIAQAAPPLERVVPRVFAKTLADSPVVIAIARDPAFNFYYPDNLELLSRQGAVLREFRPLYGEPLPEDADGLYIGGGYPEEFAAELSQQSGAMVSIRDGIENGLPTYAECGGYMYLSREIVGLDGRRWPMVGVIPATVRMTRELTAIGYREVEARRDCLLLRQGERIRGHEFHYSRMEPEWRRTEDIYTVYAGERVMSEGFAQDNLLASYTHLHFAANPLVVRRWLDACRTYRARKRAKGDTPEDGASFM